VARCIVEMHPTETNERTCSPYKRMAQDGTIIQCLIRKTIAHACAASNYKPDNSFCRNPLPGKPLVSQIGYLSEKAA
jgi:hypothetical protein